MIRTSMPPGRSARRSVDERKGRGAEPVRKQVVEQGREFGGQELVAALSGDATLHTLGPGSGAEPAARLKRTNDGYPV